MGNPERFQFRCRVVDRFNQTITLAARIHYDRAVRAVIHQQITILLERADGESLD
jgi:hypothetical protein